MSKLAGESESNLRKGELFHCLSLGNKLFSFFLSSFCSPLVFVVFINILKLVLHVSVNVCRLNCWSVFVV